MSDSVDVRLTRAEEGLREVYRILYGIRPGEQDRDKIYHDIGKAQGTARGVLLVNEADTAEIDALWKDTLASIGVAL